MSTYGLQGTPTYSVTYNTLDEMLASVPDNNEQSIQASDIRNSIFTLWDKVDNYVVPTASNIYNSNGSLDSNRTVSLNGKTLGMSGSSVTTMFFPSGRLGIGSSVDRGYLIDVNGYSTFRSTLFFNNGVADTINIGTSGWDRTTTGIRNVRVGGMRFLNNVIFGVPLVGTRNAMFGHGSGDFLTSGSDNTLLGPGAGSVNLSGYDSTIKIGNTNVIIGHASGHPFNSLANGQGSQPFLTDGSSQFLVGTVEGTIMYGNIQTRQLVVNPDFNTMPSLSNPTQSIPPSAQFVINSSSSVPRGFLPPRMTGSQAESISSPAEGLMVYATDGSGTTITSKGWWGYDGSTWVKFN